MYRIFYIMSNFLATAYQPARSASTAIPKAGKVRLNGEVRVRVLIMSMAAVSLVACAHVAQADPLLRSDPHVAEMFNVLRALRAEGAAPDMTRLDARLREMGRAHAVEWDADAAPAERMMLRTGHQAWASAQTHPEILNSLEAFNRSIGAW
jgi:hypothetical protein